MGYLDERSGEDFREDEEDEYTKSYKEKPYKWTPSWTRTWYSSDAQIEALRKIGASIAGAFDFTIEVKEYEAAVAHTNLKDKKITIGTSGIYQNGSDYYVGILLHEIAHIKNSPHHDNPVIEPIKTFRNKVVGWSMFNMVEDRRIDERMKQEYPGAHIYYDAYYQPTLKQISSKLMDISEEIPETNTIDEAINAQIQKAQVDAANASIPWTPELQAKVINATKHWLMYRVVGIAAMVVGGYVDEDMTTNCKEADAMVPRVVGEVMDAADPMLEDHEIVTSAMNVLRILDKLIPDEQWSQENAPNQGHGEGEDGEADGGEGSAPSHDAKSMYEEMAGEVPGGHKTTKWDAMSFDLSQRYEHADSSMTSKAEFFKRKLLGVMRENERTKYVGNKRKGLLDKKILNRVARGNYRLYRKRIDPKSKKYAVAIVVDCSGSMWSARNYSSTKFVTPGRTLQNIDHALRAVALMTRVFRGLGFPTGVTIYGRKAKTVLRPKDRYVVKTINDKMEKSDGMFYYSGDNETNAGVEEGLKYLRKVGADKQKLMVIITDGGLNKSDVQASRRMLQKEMKHGDFHPMLFYVDAHEEILNDEDYEAHIYGGEGLIDEAIRLMKNVVPPSQAVSD